MPKPKKVLFVIDNLDPGGAQTLLLDLVSGLDRSRFVPLVCSLRPPRAFTAEFSQTETRVVHFGKIRLNPLKLYFLWALIRREKVDIVHTHLTGSRILGTAAGCLAGVERTFSHEHSGGRSRWFERAFLFPLDRLLMRCTERIFAVSREAARFCIKEKGLPGDRVEILPNWVSPERFARRKQWREELRRSWGIPAEGKVIGAVGRLQPVKGYRYLIEAAPGLLERHPDLHFVLAGDGPRAGELKELAAELNVASAFHFVGFVSRIERAYSAFDLFVQPSLYETFGLSVLEAMAAGCPVVASAVGGVGELLEDGRTGLLVPPQNPTALTEALERLLDNPKVGTLMAEAALKEVHAHFRRDRAIERIQLYYDQLSPASGPSTVPN